MLKHEPDTESDVSTQVMTPESSVATHIMTPEGSDEDMPQQA